MFILGTYTNSADIDQALQNAASGQALNCLLTRNSIQNGLEMTKFTW